MLLKVDAAQHLHRCVQHGRATLTSLLAAAQHGHDSTMNHSCCLQHILLAQLEAQSQPPCCLLSALQLRVSDTGTVRRPCAAADTSVVCASVLAGRFLRLSH